MHFIKTKWKFPGKPAATKTKIVTRPPVSHDMGAVSCIDRYPALLCSFEYQQTHLLRGATTRLNDTTSVPVCVFRYYLIVF